MFSPLYLAPSTTVLPMPLAICLAPCPTCLVAWSTLVLSAALAAPQPRTATARKAGATHNARICRVRVMAVPPPSVFNEHPFLTESQIPQNEQDNHNHTDDVEDIVHGSLLSGGNAAARGLCLLPL